jgi:hypothetical protein
MFTPASAAYLNSVVNECRQRSSSISPQMKLSNCHTLKNAFFSIIVKHHIIIETKQQNNVF